MARGADQHRNPQSDIDIAQAAAMRPIGQVAADKLGIPDEALSAYGRYKAKISLDYIRTLADRPAESIEDDGFQPAHPGERGPRGLSRPHARGAAPTFGPLIYSSNNTVGSW